MACNLGDLNSDPQHPHLDPAEVVGESETGRSLQPGAELRLRKRPFSKGGELQKKQDIPHLWHMHAHSQIHRNTRVYIHTHTNSFHGTQQEQLTGRSWAPQELCHLANKQLSYGNIVQFYGYKLKLLLFLVLFFRQGLVPEPRLASTPDSRCVRPVSY